MAERADYQVPRLHWHDSLSRGYRLLDSGQGSESQNQIDLGWGVLVHLLPCVGVHSNYDGVLGVWRIQAIVSKAECAHE